MIKTILIVVLGSLLIVLISFMLALASGQYTNSELIEYSEQCLDCHEDYDASLAGTPHQLTKENDIKSPLASGCIGCHEGWKEHVEDPSSENISNPSQFNSSRQAQTCAHCHTTSHQAFMESSDPHMSVDVNCTTCHKIHIQASFKVKSSNDLCAECHSEVMSEFKRRSAHPLGSGNIECIDCHSLSDIEDPVNVAGLDWNCQSCHPDKAGPFVHEHPPSYTHSINGGGCIECHQPHGSIVDRLLKEPGEGVCRQCHETPSGHVWGTHGDRGIQYKCTACHSQIHGSYDNANLLDPLMGATYTEDCYESGCHGDD